MMNFETAARQALGTHFETKKDDPRLVADLLAGKLTLPPHARWTLPSEPTWTEDPFSDNNWQFQYHMLRWLDPLRRAGQAGDVRAAEMWEHYARSWIEANPPGGSQSRWAWIDMTDGIRALELCHGLCVVGEQAWLVRSLEQHRDWLSDPAHIKNGNHGLHQTVGLFVVSAVLEDRATMDTAVEWLGQRLQQAWDEQGVNEEGSLAYHRMNYNWWTDTMTRLDLEGVARPAGAERLDLAPMEMAHATSPLGKLARIGDTNAASISDVDHPYAQYVTSNGARGSHPEETTAVYQRGYAYIRSGWGEKRPFNEETYLTAVFGPQNKVHGHRDGGSITYCSRGVQWLHDQGRFYYGKDAMQRYVVSRESHSLIVLPDRTPRSSAVVELIHQDETDAYVDLLFTDPSYDDVEISRRVVYLKHWDLTVVLDRVESEEPVRVEQRWHCGARVRAKALSLGFGLEEGDRAFHVAALTSDQRRDVRRGQKTPLVGWMATGWRRSAPVDVATVYDEGSDVVVGALLGTWCPPAVDLLVQRLDSVSDISAPVESLIPDSLRKVPWDGALSRPGRRRPAELEVTCRVIDGTVLTAVADGPGRYFRFDVIEADGTLIPGRWRGGREFALEIESVAGKSLRVAHRNSPSDEQTKEVPLETAPEPPRMVDTDQELAVDDPRLEVLRDQAGPSIPLRLSEYSQDESRRLSISSCDGSSVVEVVDTLDAADGRTACFWIPDDTECLLRGSGAELFRAGAKIVELTWQSAFPVRAAIERSAEESEGRRDAISLSVAEGAAEISTQLRIEDFLYRDWGLRPDSGPWRQFAGEVPVNFLLEEIEGATDLAIIFSALGPRGGFTYNYKNTLDGMPVHKLYILDDFGDQGAYFYSEARDLRIYRSVLRTIHFVMDEIGVPPSRVHSLGTSKGGTAALIFGASAGFSSILVGAPQVNIGSFLERPHPNILEFMTGGTDEDSIGWANRIVRNHLKRISSTTSIHVLIGDADHHFGTHHADLRKMLHEQGHQNLTEEILSGVDDKGIGAEYRRWLPSALLRAVGQRQELDMWFEGWRLTGFVRGKDLLLRLRSPEDDSAAAVYVYAQKEVRTKHVYRNGDRWLHQSLTEDLRVRLFVKRSGDVKAVSSSTIGRTDDPATRDPVLQRAVRALVPAHVGEAARGRGRRMLRDGVVTHPALGEIPLDTRMMWSAVDGRTAQRYVHGFLFLSDWHEEVLPSTPSAAGFVAQLFSTWAEARPWPTRAADLSPDSMAYHDETTAQRGLHLSRFLLDNWTRLATDERRRLGQLLRDMIDLLSSEWFYGGVNNHGMFQDCALILLGSVGRVLSIVDEAEAEAASRTASGRLLKYFRHSFNREGVHLENSPGYHLMASRSLRDVIPLAFEAAPEAGRELQRIYSAAEQYAMHSIMPNGMVPPLSDTKQFEVGRSNHATTFSGEEFAWAATAGKRGQEPKERTAVFPDAGYAVHRSGWHPDADWILFTAGYRAQFHHHADDLSLLFFREGGLVLSEAGPFGYDYSDSRTQYAFSQWAHSTIVVDGKSLPRVDAEPGGVSLQDRSGSAAASGDADIAVRGVCSRHPRWTHTRDVMVRDTEDGRLRAEVVDQVTCTDGEEHEFECLWHAGPGVTIEIREDSALFQRGARTVLRMAWSSADPVVASVGRGESASNPKALRFPTFGAVEDGTVLSLTSHRRSLEMVTLIE